MLLPSALPFDALHQPHQSTSTSTPPPTSPGGFLSLSSCRALQAILGSRPASPFPLSISTRFPPSKEKRAASNRREEPQRTPLGPLTQNGRVSRQSQRERTRARGSVREEEPRRSNKRPRTDFESMDERRSGDSTTDSDYACSTHRALDTRARTIQQPMDRDNPSTPKRQRRIPLLMPLGLNAEDFEGLDATPQTLHQIAPKEIDEEVDMPTEVDGADEVTERDWSAADDRILVSTVLDKLSLSKQDWNDCARRMGKEGNSLGKRWRVLVGEGDVGLRRGSGGRSRPELRRTWTEGTSI